jgi:hypothetical protein
MRPIILLPLATLPSLISCTGGSKKDAAPTTVQGTIAYTSQSPSGETVCDSTIRFTGSDFTGECDGCDYSFKVETEETEDRSTAACLKLWQFSWMANHPEQNEMLFAFQSNYEDYARNILWSGYTHSGYGGESSDSGDTGGSNASSAGGAIWEPIAWEFTEAYSYYEEYYADYSGGTAALNSSQITWTAFMYRGGYDNTPYESFPSTHTVTGTASSSSPTEPTCRAVSRRSTPPCPSQSSPDLRGH